MSSQQIKAFIQEKWLSLKTVCSTWAMMHSLLPLSPRSSWWELQFNWVWLGRWGFLFCVISSQGLQYLCGRLCAMLSRSVMSDSLQPHGLWPGSSVHGDPPGTGVGCYALLQGSFPTQRSNPGLLHCRWILYHLSHQGRP